MKKKLISTLLVFALVLCAVPVAFPIISYARECPTPGSDCGYSDCIIHHPPAADVVGGGTEEDPAYGYYKRLYVWVERTRDADGVKADYVKMELVPVDEEEKAEYLERYKDFTGWDEDETLRLYSPSRNWLNVQLLGHVEKFESEHYYGGYTVVEIGLIDENLDPASGTVYYEHKGIEADESSPFRLSLRLGEYRIMLPEEYSLKDFSFAAKPDGNGGWDIILKDAEGGNIDYTVLE